MPYLTCFIHWITDKGLDLSKLVWHNSLMGSMHICTYAHMLMTSHCCTMSCDIPFTFIPCLPNIICWISFPTLLVS